MLLSTLKKLSQIYLKALLLFLLWWALNITPASSLISAVKLTDSWALWTVASLSECIQLSLPWNEKYLLTDMTGCQEWKSRMSWAIILWVGVRTQAPRSLLLNPKPQIFNPCPFINVTSSYTQDETTQHVQQNHLRRQCSQPRCVQQNSASTARGSVPMLHTAERSATITERVLLMIFTFTLRFTLWRQGTTCAFARHVCSHGEESDSTGCVWNTLFLLLFYGWLNGIDGFPHWAAQLLWGTLINHHDWC